MDEAMALIRDELGQDAVVLKSTSVETRRLLPWSATRQQVEVSAQQSIRHPASPNGISGTTVPASGQQKLRTLAQTISAGPCESATQRAPAHPLEIPPENRTIVGDDLAPPPTWVPTRAKPITVPKRMIDSNENKRNMLANGHEAPGPVDQMSPPALPNPVPHFLPQQRPAGFANLPHEQFQYYLKLIESDVDDDLACELISKLRTYAAPGSLAKSAAIQSMLTALIEREMRCVPPITPHPGRREIVMLIGPTGVGKTTTLAKLAGHFHLRKGIRVGLVTVDSYRVGAVEQLQTYAEILQVPLKAASNPDELRMALDDLDDVDLVLIDTAGRSPWDDGKLNELRELVDVSAADHVLLVLSMATGSKVLARIASRFLSSGPTSLVLSKLDEALGIGAVLSIARAVPVPVSYLTTGQEVPDQIEPAHPARLAKLILGENR